MARGDIIEIVTDRIISRVMSEAIADDSSKNFVTDDELDKIGIALTTDNTTSEVTEYNKLITQEDIESVNNNSAESMASLAIMIHANTANIAGIKIMGVNDY